MSTGAPDAGFMAAAFEVMRLRAWFHELNEMLKQKRFNIPIHLGFGHEAAAVAMDRTMREGDRLCLTHRNAAYNLARAKSLEAVLAHYGLESSSSEGALMGSMNLAIESSGIPYSSSILGNDLAVAAGIAMNRVLLGKPGVVFATTGDGAMEEGVFWETAIFARSHKLPLVIVVENNDCSMSSSIVQRRMPIALDKICEGLAWRYLGADGAQLGDVLAALRQARESAAAGQPACVELKLATFCQHAGPTPGWPGDPLNIDVANGLVVEATARDPVFNLREALGAPRFEELTARLDGERHG